MLMIVMIRNASLHFDLKLCSFGCKYLLTSRCPLTMPFLNTRAIIIRTRRVLEFLSVITFFTIIYLFSSRSSIVPADQGKLLGRNGNNPYLPHESLSNDDPMERLDHGRPELAKYIHLDLKGAPPRAKEFYPSFFKFLNQMGMGVKGFLIEYEDMLPLRGQLANVSLVDLKSFAQLFSIFSPQVTHRNPYTEEDIQLILQAAKANQFEVIPLVQTFGHLEWILKLQEFLPYRDNVDSPMVISPCLEQTYTLLEGKR